MTSRRFLFSLITGLTVALFLLPACEKTPPDMVRVSSGYFMMGTDEVDVDELAIEVGFPHPWYEDEHPGRKVNLPTFTIDRFEVTNRQFAEFVSATNRHPPEDWPNGHSTPEKADYPVVFVSWHDADSYCRWAGKRLPIEAEWEKAARGTDGRKYPWGDTFDPKRAKIATGSVMFSTPGAVGHYEDGKSPYGAYDMIGNVWEWTDSWYQPYPGNTATNERYRQQLRVTRGLSFMSVGHFGGDEYTGVASIVARASFRSFDFPTSRLADVGFRCAK